MTKPTTLLLAAAALLGALAGARVASAQTDINPPAPNVMLLVDTSGSMEYKASSNQFPVCDPTSSLAGQNEKSRWIDLVEVLTGDIKDYRCDKVDRNSDGFRAEYALGTTPPADYQYTNPYHRPLSGTCTVGPGTAALNAYEFPSTAFKYHLYNNTSSLCTSFAQENDGILDAFINRARFGLMTFDTSPSEKTGVAGTNANYAEGVEGTWSYFVGSQPAQGMPAGCIDPVMQEVGARNAAAPPWEGRMIAFGSPTADLTALTTKNRQIQEVLLAARPFGATPIAGMMDDALQFFWNDQSLDPLDSNQDFGPYQDPYKDCRERVIVLVTDGEPNLDLRPYCEGPGGDCPYDNKPEQTAALLATAAANKRVRTFVIGLAAAKPILSDGTTEFDCAGMSTADLSSSTGPCNTMLNEPAVQVCCTLHRIAFEGGTTRARFGDTKKTLREALSGVMSSVTPPAASRTLPVFATVSSATSGRGEAFRFFTGFNAQPFDLWSGIIERQRFVCSDSLVPEPQTIEATLGDDFVLNVNSTPGDRHFISVKRAVTPDGAIHSARSIRPRITSDVDGAGIADGDQHQAGTKDENVGAFADEVDPRAMSIDATTCPGEPNLANCSQMIMRWNVGLTNAEDESRCGPAGTDCNLVADVYHSTPAVVSRPSAFIRDETYDRFAITNASRPLVLYTSTNDGVLHAFRADQKNTDNNELWAFIPPAVLPNIKSQYARTHQQLLDGVPVVKDVVAKLNDDNVTYSFERGIAAARSATGTWRTVLVQSFGNGRPGYFAVDITDPLPSIEAGKGPQFLWQLTTDNDGNPLFGTGGGTPAITTVLLQDSAGSDLTKEVAVAVLPGGPGGPGTAGSGSGCSRGETQFSWIDSAYTPRQNVRCYEGTGKEGRSLTIVRLDTGQIIRTFRKQLSDIPAAVAAASSGNVVGTLVPELVSPITGTPVAFPGQVGAVADRIFVGDADGALWRVNLSSTDPTEWTMRIFWDGYPAGTKSHQFGDGQPIMVPPVVSLDPFGNVTVAFATGDQDVLTPTTGMSTYLWSLKEVPNNDGTDLVTQLNWYLGGPGDAGDERRFLNGERVTGPISLFNEGLFFTTYKAPDPSSSEKCENGSTRLWGVHYLNRNNALAPEEGGQPVLPRPGVSPIELVQVIRLSDIPDVPDDATVFGASIAQLPTCFDDRTGSPDDVDPYTGTGMHRSITNVTPGSFQIVMHTGSGGNADTGGKLGITNINLPTPSSVTRIDSWAAIVE